MTNPVCKKCNDYKKYPTLNDTNDGIIFIDCPDCTKPEKENESLFGYCPTCYHQLTICGHCDTNPNKFKIGDKVYYHHFIGSEHDGNIYQITSLFHNNSGTYCATLEGKSSYYAVANLSIAPKEFQLSKAEQCKAKIKAVLQEFDFSIVATDNFSERPDLYLISNLDLAHNVFINTLTELKSEPVSIQESLLSSAYNGKTEVNNESMSTL